jgi:hypothetical protein
VVRHEHPGAQPEPQQQSEQQQQQQQQQPLQSLQSPGAVESTSDKVKLIVNQNVFLMSRRYSRRVGGQLLHYACIFWPKYQAREHWSFVGAGADKELQILKAKTKGMYKFNTPDRTEDQQDQVQLDIERVRGALARQIETWKGNLDEVRTRSMALFARMRRPYWPPVQTVVSNFFLDMCFAGKEAKRAEWVDSMAVAAE